MPQENEERDENKDKVWKPKKSASRKQGIDRRMNIKNKQFDTNMHTKLAGEEVPKTRRVS